MLDNDKTQLLQQLGSPFSGHPTQVYNMHDKETNWWHTAYKSSCCDQGRAYITELSYGSDVNRTFSAQRTWHFWNKNEK